MEISPIIWKILSLPSFTRWGCLPISRAISICGEAILIAVADMDVINAVTKVLYPEVAKRFNTTASGWSGPSATPLRWPGTGGDLETLQKYFGYTVSNVKGKPTNSEFIAMIADRLQLQQKEM